MGPIPEFVMSITLWRKKAVEQMSAIAGDASEHSVVCFSTGAVECQGGDCTVSESDRTTQECFQACLVCNTGVAPLGWRCICHLGDDCCLENSVKSVSRQAVLSQRAQCK